MRQLYEIGFYFVLDLMRKLKCKTTLKFLYSVKIIIFFKTGFSKLKSFRGMQEINVFWCHFFIMLVPHFSSPPSQQFFGPLNFYSFLRFPNIFLAIIYFGENLYVLYAPFTWQKVDRIWKKLA